IEDIAVAPLSGGSSGGFTGPTGGDSPGGPGSSSAGNRAGAPGLSTVAARRARRKAGGKGTCRALPWLLQGARQLLEVLPRPQRVEILVLLKLLYLGRAFEVAGRAGLPQQLDRAGGVLRAGRQAERVDTGQLVQGPARQSPPFVQLRFELHGVSEGAGLV